MSEVWSTAQYKEWLSSQPPAQSSSLRAVPTKRRVEHEYDEQVLFFAAVEWLAEHHPDRKGELDDVFSTSSGGARSPKTAGRLKEAGQRRGVPDIECWVPRGKWHGLAIELKPADSGRITPEQAARIRRFTARGYRALCIHGWKVALTELCQYLDLPLMPDPDGAARDVLARRAFFRKLVRSQRLGRPSATA